MATTKAEKKAAKAEKKAQKAKGATAPANAIPAEGQPDNAAGAAPAEKTPRIKKNATQTSLDFGNPDSATTWLNEFYAQSKAQPARKGYDQHWNSEGFIHAGPADRLPNTGGVKMGVFIGDMLAKREADGDTDAGQALDFLIGFLQNRRQTLANEKNEGIRQQYEALLAAGKVTPVAAPVAAE